MSLSPALSAPDPLHTHLRKAGALLLGLLTVATVLVAFAPAGHSATYSRSYRLSQRSDQLISAARSRQGSPYKYGATGPRRFDCSGYTKWTYARVGRTLPRTSSEQSRVGRAIAKSHAVRGDLVFFYGSGGVYHTAIYAGNGYVWHAPHSGAVVHRQHLWTSRYFVRRLPVR